jgi:hypothetical protein
MDLVTGLGIGAAAFQVAGQLTSMAKEIRSCVRTIRAARKEIRPVIDDITNFAGLLRTFNHINSMDAACSLLHKAKAEQLDVHIVQQSQKVHSAFRHLLRQLRPLRTSRSASYWRVFRASVLWYLRQNNLKSLRRELKSAKLNLCLFVSVANLAITIEKFEQAILGNEAGAASIMQEM